MKISKQTNNKYGTEIKRLLQGLGFEKLFCHVSRIDCVVQKVYCYTREWLWNEHCHGLHIQAMCCIYHTCTTYIYLRNSIIPNRKQCFRLHLRARGCERYVIICISLYLLCVSTVQRLHSFQFVQRISNYVLCMLYTIQLGILPSPIAWCSKKCWTFLISLLIVIILLL